jgi:flagellar basal body-associated protein FliL
MLARLKELINKVLDPKNEKIVLITLVVLCLILAIVCIGVFYGMEIKSGIYEFFDVVPRDIKDIQMQNFTPPREKTMRDIEPEMLYQKPPNKPQTNHGQVGQQINNISLSYPTDNDMVQQFPQEFQMSDKIYLHNMNQYIPQQVPQSLYGGNRFDESQNNMQQSIPVQRLAY